MKKSAVISPDGVYRYSLEREWDEHEKKMIFCMLNPSTADAEKDDPTIRRCIGFAKREGNGGIIVVNAFPFRATNPKDMWKAAESGVNILGSNEEHLYKNCSHQNVICAWGSAKVPEDNWYSISDTLKTFGATLWCLGKTKDRKPRHPLYLPANAELIKLS